MNLRLIKRSGAFLLAALVLLGIAGCSGQGDIQIGNKTLPRDSENLALCLSEIQDLSPIRGFQKATKVSLCNNALTDLSALKVNGVLNLELAIFIGNDTLIALLAAHGSVECGLVCDNGSSLAIC